MLKHERIVRSLLSRQISGGRRVFLCAALPGLLLLSAVSPTHAQSVFDSGEGKGSISLKEGGRLDFNFGEQLANLSITTSDFTKLTVKGSADDVLSNKRRGNFKNLLFSLRGKPDGNTANLFGSSHPGVGAGFTFGYGLSRMASPLRSPAEEFLFTKLEFAIIDGTKGVEKKDGGLNVSKDWKIRSRAEILAEGDAEKVELGKQLSEYLRAREALSKAGGDSVKQRGAVQSIEAGKTKLAALEEKFTPVSSEVKLSSFSTEPNQAEIEDKLKDEKKKLAQNAKEVAKKQRAVNDATEALTKANERDAKKISEAKITLYEAIIELEKQKNEEENLKAVFEGLKTQKALLLFDSEATRDEFQRLVTAVREKEKAATDAEEALTRAEEEALRKAEEERSPKAENEDLTNYIGALTNYTDASKKAEQEALKRAKEMASQKYIEVLEIANKLDLKKAMRAVLETAKKDVFKKDITALTSDIADLEAALKKNKEEPSPITTEAVEKKVQTLLDAQDKALDKAIKALPPPKQEALTKDVEALKAANKALLGAEVGLEEATMQLRNTSWLGALVYVPYQTREANIQELEKRKRVHPETDIALQRDVQKKLEEGATYELPERVAYVRATRLVASTTNIDYDHLDFRVALDYDRFQLADTDSEGAAINISTKNTTAIDFLMAYNIEWGGAARFNAKGEERTPTPFVFGLALGYGKLSNRSDLSTITDSEALPRSEFEEEGTFQLNSDLAFSPGILKNQVWFNLFTRNSFASGETSRRYGVGAFLTEPGNTYKAKGGVSVAYDADNRFRVDLIAGFNF